MKVPSVPPWCTACMDDVRTLVACHPRVVCTISACASAKLDCAERQQVEPTVGRKDTLFEFLSTRFITSGGSVAMIPVPVALADAHSHGR